MRTSPPLVRFLASRLLSADHVEHLREMNFQDLGHGFDAYGAHRDWVEMAVGLARPMYDYYFRCISYGAENIPDSGAAILAGNHSGTLPFDGAMLFADVLRNADPPRLPRAVSDLFVPKLPFINVLFQRCGVVPGSRHNVQHLLRNGELLMIFPEGTPGIGKDFSKRYQLQRWRVGHAELAIRHQVPIVPVAIVGAEEQMPQIAKIKRFRLFGAPYLPITLVPFPLPVRYHIRYGEPIETAGVYPAEVCNDPDVVRSVAEKVKAAVQGLIDESLEQRRGIFN